VRIGGIPGATKDKPVGQHRFASHERIGAPDDEDRPPKTEDLDRERALLGEGE